MNRITCNVITDLMELYADNVVSEDTRRLVEEHLGTCEDCMKKLETIEQKLCIPAETNTEPIKRIGRKIKKKNVVISLISVFIIAVALMGAFIFISRFEVAIAYEKAHIFNVEQGENDWEILVHYSGNIDHYWIHNRHIDETTMEYYIHFTETYYTRNFSNSVASNSYISIPAYEWLHLPLYNGVFISPDEYVPGIEITPSEEAVEVQTVRIYYINKLPDGGEFDLSERYLIWEK